MNRYDDPRWYEEQSPDSSGSAHQPRPAQTQASYIPAYTGSFSREYMNLPPPSFRAPRPPRRNAVQIIVVAVLLLLAFSGGWFGNQYYSNGFFTPSSQSQKYEHLFQEAWNIVDQNYVDRKNVNYKNMSYSAIEAMINTLHDKDHTRFLTPQEVQTENQQLSGSYTGIGIYLEQDTKTGKLIITSPIPGSPAEKAGIKPNDILVAVNGTNVTGKSISQVSSLIEGKAGTSVNITVQRPSTNQTLTFHIIRAVISVPNVEWYYIAQDHIVDIQILQFADGVSNQLKTALTQAKSMGANKIILDLRNNPGGYLNEAIDTASYFIKSGNVLLEQDSKGNRTPVPVNGNPIDTTDPMVVLVNGNTASAAEIVTGALEDNKRAEVIGQKTFGTGTVLQQFNLSDGSAILVGVQEWLTPDGQFIRQNGLTPQITVALSSNAQPLTPTVESDNHMTEQQILNSSDTQLVAAIKYLDTH